MNEIEFTGGEKRMLAYEKLKVFLTNPGMFCVVVIGSRGTGKRFAIKKAFEHLHTSNKKKREELKQLCLNKLNFLSAHEFPVNKKELDEKFYKHLNETLVIEDFEYLENKQKIILLEALSTENGKFGISNKVDIRVLFTSSKKVNDLRNEAEQNAQLLWDRISQLIVELPSFQDEGSNILSDFQNTWKKMTFENIVEYKELAEMPQFDGLTRFLETKQTEFVGGFRDLDKIACLYFNYRIFHYGKKRKIDFATEKEVFKDVKEDFLGKTQMSDEVSTINSFFDFDAVKASKESGQHPTLDDFNSAFKVRFREWLISKHGTLSRAALILGCSNHTLKNYKEGRATKAKREAKSSLTNEN